jgi:ribosomal protein L19
LARIPTILNDIQAQRSIRVHVWVKHFRRKSHFRRFIGVIMAKRQSKLKHTALPRRIFRADDLRRPDENVIVVMRRRRATLRVRKRRVSVARVNILPFLSRRAQRTARAILRVDIPRINDRTRVLGARVKARTARATVETKSANDDDDDDATRARARARCAPRSRRS